MKTGVFISSYFAGLILASVIRGWYSIARRKITVREKYETKKDMALMGLAGFGFLLPLVWMFSSWIDFANYDIPVWIGWVGLVVYILAQLLLWRTHVDLGVNWSKVLEIREDQELITHGVFRRIRHPMYAAHVLWGIAQLLMLENWLAGWSLLVMTAPIMLFRMPVEERMMIEAFGDDYRTYIEKTGRILPRL
jgi:protein-S-isoprenylcysteine O-methyltransferase Ste14